MRCGRQHVSSKTKHQLRRLATGLQIQKPVPSLQQPLCKSSLTTRTSGRMQNSLRGGGASWNETVCRRVFKAGGAQWTNQSSHRCDPHLYTRQPYGNGGEFQISDGRMSNYESAEAVCLLVGGLCRCAGECGTARIESMVLFVSTSAHTYIHTYISPYDTGLPRQVRTSSSPARASE